MQRLRHMSRQVGKIFGTATTITYNYDYDFKITPWKLPGATFWPSRSCSKLFPRSVLGLPCGPAPEKIQNPVLRASWDNYLARPGNNPKYPPGSFLGQLFGPAPEIIQNIILEASWDNCMAQPRKLFKIVSWRLPGTTL